MKYLIILVSCAICACANSSQSTPEELFKTADKAVESGDVEFLSKCITTNEEITPEMSKAVAEIILIADDYRQFRENNKDRIKEISTNPLGGYLFNLSLLSRLPDFATVADSGTYNAEENTYVVKVQGRDFPFQLTETNGQFTFWPPYMRPSEELLSTVELYEEFKVAIQKSTLEESQEAVQNLVLRYVQPTDLAYKDQQISGMINGKEWSVNSGKAEQKEAFGKQTIKVELSDAEAPKDCRVIFQGNKVTFSVESPGEYDFAQTGQNITLYDKSTNHNEVLTDGKLTVAIDQENNVVKGKIAASKNGEHYVNGTFEIEICGEIK